MTIVMLHPVGLDGGCFGFLDSPRLADAIRYDCLWHGGRPQPEGPLTIEAMALDVLANTSGVLDLVGVSMGGQIAQRVAMRAPDRVRSLFVTSAINPSEAENERASFPEEDEKAAMVLRLGIEGVIEWAIERWFTEKAIGVAAHPGIAYIRDRLRGDTAEQFAAGWNALAQRRPSCEEQRLLLTMPTTVLHPMQDNSTLESCEALAALLPDARIRTCPGPHMVQLEEPRAFEAALLEHIDWVEGRPS